MARNRPTIFGPAYLDVVFTLDRPLLAGGPTLDQSLPAIRLIPRDDGVLEVVGPTGDRLVFVLPPDQAEFAATCELCEPVLARTQPGRMVTGEYPVASAVRQLGGMGAGYAKALGGLLRMPVGDDAVGREILQLLAQHEIDAVPALLPDCSSDTSLLLQSPQGDKLAIGVRQAMIRWQAGAEDYALDADASALVFCGAPNALTAAVLEQAPEIPVMCAPALRNVCDRSVPLAGLAAMIDYLTLNALEWAQLDGAEEMRKHVPVITVTEGARGSRILLGEHEIHIPAVPFEGPSDTNRAGETYAATFFRVLLAACPEFPRRIIMEAMEHAGQLAAAQAAKQLAMREFGFPRE
ncbi:MAG: carbohydrate kinase family protein [Armatimonadota bacterium]